MDGDHTAIKDTKKIMLFTTISDTMNIMWEKVLWCLTLLELFHSSKSTSTTSRPWGKEAEKSLKVSKAMVEEAGVKHTQVFLLRSVCIITFQIDPNISIYSPNDQD